ncbi:MAG: LysM peptidoglycan-binding domain-containing protein, partial [Candidatus Doudnabacteria bacterium]|nr:LysM peptidoglycan-binding domain-containing protein [Candidatus Doudnabacteria bacterium]
MRWHIILKRLGIKLLLVIFKIAVSVKRMLFFAAIKAILPFKLLAKVLLWPFVLWGYKIYLLYRPGAKASFVAGLNRYLGFILMLGIAAIVVLMNLTGTYAEAASLAEGKESLLSSLIGEEEQEEFIEETILPLESGAGFKKIGYLDEEASLGPGPVKPITSEGAVEEEDILAGLTEDQSALVKPIIPVTASTPVSRQSIEEYVVREGDIIGNIAEKMGVSIATILWENNLSSRSIIKPGDKLKILPVSGISYKVKKGDTLSGIAKKYKTDDDKIIETNNLTDAADIAIGQILILPDASPLPVYHPPISSSYAFLKKYSPVIQSLGELLWPTRTHRLSQYYNWRHHAVDINGEFGDPIWAAEAGTVESVIYGRYGYGYHIIINHGNG